ncbi:MAG TPA: methyl-accepting chemotaxis protein, partial [Anaeromyxobacter sp.]|nr:methyl-accepting chemotaxis protein [Anaeromyxobacter sp.]
MLDNIATVGVKRSVLLSIVIALGLAGGITAFAVNREVRRSLERALRERGDSHAHMLAMEVAAPLEAGDDRRVVQELETFWDEDLFAYAVVLRADRSVVARRIGRAHAGTAEDVVAAHAASGFAPTFSTADEFGFTRMVKAPVARPDGAKEERTAGWVLLAVQSGDVNREIREVRNVVLLWLGVGGVLLAALVYFFVAGILLRPLNQMSAVARRVSDCDLTARAAKLGDDELGTLAESLNRIGENLAVTLSRVQNVTGGVAIVIERISKTGAAVSSGAGTVSARVLDTSSSMGQMIASLKGIADNVEVLAQSAEESSSSILEMAATNDEVAENIQGLAASVEETTAAIEQMTYSIKEVAKNIEELSATAEETSSSMNEMDVSISQVETNANETAKLSEQAQ